MNQTVTDLIRHRFNYSINSNFCQEVGNWLETFDWEWWATFTFRWDIGQHSAKKCFRKFWDRLGVDYYMVIEPHLCRESVHIHALMRGVSDLRRLTMMDKWDERYGYARIYPYIKWLGARYYVTKYMMKNVADWDLKIEQRSMTLKVNNALPQQKNLLGSM